jgi:hypothetical protein
MVFRITNETKYAISGTRSTEENKAVVFKNIKGNIIGENTENIKINNGVDICNETKKGSIILKTSSTSEIDQTLIFPPVAATPGENQILQNDGTGQLSWVSHGGTGESTGDVTGPNSSEDMTVAIYNGDTGKSIKNTNITIDTNNNLSTAGTISGSTGFFTSNLTLGEGNNQTIYPANDGNSTVIERSSSYMRFWAGKGSGSGAIYYFTGLDSNINSLEINTSSNVQHFITSTTGNISFDNENLTTTGTISGATGSTFGNLTLSNGSITDSNGSIDFENNNLSTTGTISATAGATIGNLTLENGSITDSDGAIDFGNNNLSTTGTISVAGQVCFSAALTPDTITGDEDNYDPVNLNSSNFLRLGTDGGNYTISGITAPNPPTNQLLFVCNVGTSGKLQLLDDNSNSNDVNRFLLGSSKTIKNNEGILLIYDVLSSRWRSASM